MADQESNGAAPEVQPAAELLPVVYQELRRLAAALADRLPPGQTLQPTALVHKAYLLLVGEQDPGWHGRRHCFGAETDRSSKRVAYRQQASRRHCRPDARESLAAWRTRSTGSNLCARRA